jgi:heme oxygenase
MSSNLATKLREGTKKAHTMAENVGFVRCFLRGVVEKNSYRKLVANFYFVYAAMEEELERHKDHPVVSKVYFPELHRKQTLEQDLAYYYGAGWRDQVAPSAAGQKYIDRIREIANTQPELLVGHSYTRYLGDLSGGQVLKGIAQRAMNLVDGEGTAFYEPLHPSTQALRAGCAFLECREAIHTHPPSHPRTLQPPALNTSGLTQWHPVLVP